MTTIPLRAAARGGRGAPAVMGPLLRGPVLVWAALFGNVLTFLAPTPLVPLPTPVGQLLAQAMLPVALVLALLANPGLVLRINAVLVLLTAMAVLALMVSVHNEFLIGSSYRAVRLLLFVAVLWLLTPWWGRRDLPLLRAHLIALRVIVGTVLLGAALFPGAAFNDEGRLQGSIWPIPPPQVGHYAAMLLGCTVVLWFTGSMRGRTTVVTLVATLAALLLSHTRTALAGMVIGIALAAAGLFLGHARVRRTVVTVGVVGGLVAVTAGPALLTWLSRGQTAQEASQLTGRTKVWTAVGQAPRTWVQELFGTGLSNKSFNGLPIDSNWVATYVELGYAVVLLQVILLTVLLVAAIAHPRGPRRAVALFIVGYCIVASFTETGLGDASPYLLELVVVGSLLVRPTPSDDARTRSG